MMRPGTTNVLVKPQQMRGALGFTLMEMIAVIAIIAVLSAILVPQWIKRIDLKVHREEMRNLVTISNALVSQVARGANLPGSDTWKTNVTEWSMLSMPRVTANARRYQRVYYLESGANPPVGYSQNSWEGFANPPENLRAMVVSILGGDELNAVNCPDPDGGELSPGDFNELWTNGVWAGWKGSSDDFLVQRINYTPLYHRLVLLNREQNDLPQFRINGVLAPPTTLQRSPGTNNPGWQGHYLEGTVLTLRDPSGAEMTRYVVRQDMSFVWEHGKWRADILGAPESDTLSNDFAQKAKEFLAAARHNANGQGPATQQGVVTGMYNFMLAYTFWANQCPPFTTHGPSSVQVGEYKILNWLGANNGRLDVFSLNLVNK